VDVIKQQVIALEGVKAETVIPDGPSNVFPGCRISWDEDYFKVSSSEVIEALRNGHPSIEIGGGRDNVYANVSMMKPEEAGIVGRRIKEELKRASA
jgi:L-seryl-tRNA(Ser) seleniumtransferase